MLHFIITIFMTFSSYTLFAGPCPTGGSGHAVGTTPVMAQIIDKFYSSNDVHGQIELLGRHDYCPLFNQQPPRLIKKECSGDTCGETYQVALGFYVPRTLKTRLVSGKVHMTRSPGAEDRLMVFVDRLNLNGLGQEVQFNTEDSNAFMEAMEAEQISQDAVLMGAVNLVVSRLNCSKGVYPNAVPTCEFTTAKQSEIPTNANLFDILSKWNARQYVNIVGANHVAVSLLRCYRPVAPYAAASCRAVIEPAQRLP